MLTMRSQGFSIGLCWSAAGRHDRDLLQQLNHSRMPCFEHAMLHKLKLYSSAQFQCSSGDICLHIASARPARPSAVRRLASSKTTAPAELLYTDASTECDASTRPPLVNCTAGARDEDRLKSPELDRLLLRADSCLLEPACVRLAAREASA